jgi:ABC-type antimicrobial peptide transport system, ATPase component
MIEAFGLVKRYDEYTSISYDDLRFEDGQSYVMLGASGCGKSTYLNMLAGVISPTSGRVVIDSRDMAKATQKEKDAFRVAHIGYIFQDFKLLEDMTVQDNIGILRLEGVDVSRTPEVLSDLGILSKRTRRVRKLSGGEKQRVAIARALVKQPDIILADEPTGNLNYLIGRSVMEELIRASRGRTLICVTHDDRLCDLFGRVIDMNLIAHPREVSDHA